MVWKNVFLCVCVSDSTVPQELDTPGLSVYTLLISGKNVYFLYHFRSFKKGKKSAR